MKASNHLRVLFAIFVVSGFSGLIYQSVWSHYLGNFLGHAAYAQALVLAIFMGGMAIGAYLVSRTGHRWRNLLRGYALIEAGIGVMGLAFHLVFVFLLDVSYDVVMPVLSEPWLVNSYKWVLSALLILPQTLLLGMTFPLMTGGVIRRYPGFDGHTLGSLYFTNSIGAAQGVLVASFLLLPALGLNGAMLVAGVTNLVLAVAAWLLSGGQEKRSAPPVPSRGAVEERRVLLYMALGATFLSGAASFVYEIVWVRMLSLAVGTTLHAFELMLASFILGIALGGLWVRRRADHARDPMKLVGWMQVFMGMAALVSLVFYANSFRWVGFLMEVLSRSDSAYVMFNIGTAFIAILIMLPSAFFAGTTLPLFTVALLRNGQGESSIGRVYAWNTLGAILGVFAAIHLLIPLVGLRLSLFAAAVVDMSIGLVLLRWRAGSLSTSPHVFLAAGLVVVCAVLTMRYAPFDPMVLSSGVYRSGKAELVDTDQVVYYRDGKTASVSVVLDDAGIARIATNGKVDASIQMSFFGGPTPDESTMSLLAAIPLAYHEDARRAAVIGFGSGMTTHVLLADPGIEHVDTIEIEQAMVDGAKLFDYRVERAFEDSRSHIVIDDAKSFFSGQQRHYDLIISEPSNPWISGVGSLFSREFYEFVPRFLEEDGVFMQWLQLYEIDDALVGSVLNALIPAFEDYHAYMANSSDVLIIAGRKPLTKNPDFEALFRSDVGRELRHAGMSHPEQLHFRKVADAQGIRMLARLYQSPPNSDFFPVLSLNAPKTRFLNSRADGVFALSLLDTLFLEAMNVSSALPADVDLGDKTYMPRLEMTARARWLAARFSLAQSDTADASLTPEMTRELMSFEMQVREVMNRCQRGWSAYEEEMALESIIRLAELTIPYLGVDQQNGVLINPSWLACTDLPDNFSRALAILTAVAERDYQRLRSLSAVWLGQMEDIPVRYRSMNQIALIYYLLSMTVLGEYESAVQAAHVYADKVTLSGSYEKTHGFLLAWLEGKVPKQESGAQPQR